MSRQSTLYTDGFISRKKNTKIIGEYFEKENSWIVVFVRLRSFEDNSDSPELKIHFDKVVKTFKGWLTFKQIILSDESFMEMVEGFCEFKKWKNETF